MNKALAILFPDNPKNWRHDRHTRYSLDAIEHLLDSQTENQTHEIFTHIERETLHLVATLLNSGKRGISVAERVLTASAPTTDIPADTPSAATSENEFDSVMKALGKIDDSKQLARILLQAPVVDCVNFYYKPINSFVDLIRRLEAEDQFHVTYAYAEKGCFIENPSGIDQIVAGFNPDQKFEIFRMHMMLENSLTPDEAYEYVSGFGGNSEKLASLLAANGVIETTAKANAEGTMSLLESLDHNCLVSVMEEEWFPENEAALNEAGLGSRVAALKFRVYGPKAVGESGAAPPGP